MNFRNEAEVLAALNIPSWQALARDLFPRLASMIPAMDKDLAAIILPKLSADAVQELSAVIKAALNSNDRNQDRLHQADMAILAPLASAYSQADTPEERDEHWQRIREVHEAKSAKDTENKEFWFNVVKVAAGVGVAVLFAALYAARDGADQA